MLLYSKDESNKVPHGIIKLADVTDVFSVGATKFVLKQVAHGDLHFEAPAPERDSWVFTLKSGIAGAKATGMFLDQALLDLKLTAESKNVVNSASERSGFVASGRTWKDGYTARLPATQSTLSIAEEI